YRCGARPCRRHVRRARPEPLRGRRALAHGGPPGDRRRVDRARGGARRGRALRSGRDIGADRRADERGAPMIAKLTGILDRAGIAKGTGEVVINVGGVGYRVICPARTLASLPEPGSTIVLLVETEVRED